ncbi:unnamed protein product [Allacma fusca]|nr:unnamed protein product [Allacma fusca]
MEITSYSTESLPSQHSARKSGSQEGKILVGVGCPWEEDHIPSEDSCHLDMEATDINSSNLRTITRTLDRFNERAQDTINHSLPGALSSMEDSFQDFPIHRKDYLAEEGLYERSQKNEEFIGASRTSSSTTVILDSKDVYDSVRYNSLSNKESETALLQLAQPNSTNSGFKPQIKQTTLPAFNIRKPMQCSAPCLNPSPAHELRTQGDISNKSRKRPVYRTEMQSKIPTLLSPNSKLAKQKYKDPANKNNSASSPSIPSSKGNNLSVTFEGIQKVPEPYPIKGMSGDFVDEVLAPELNPRPWVDCFPTKYNEEDFEKEFHFQLIEPVSVRKNNVSGSESSMDSSSTYVIENASSRSQTMYASSLEPRHSIPYESSGHSTESLTCFLPNVSHKDRNVMTCMHRNLKRGCKSFRDCSVRQKPAGRNMRCKTSTTLQSSSPFSTRPTYKNSNSGRRNMKDPNSRVMPNELMESSGWQNPQECTGEEKSLKILSEQFVFQALNSSQQCSSPMKGCVSRFNEAFKNCLLPDMLPSTTNIPRDSLNIMREAGDFLTAYRKPGSSSFVDKLPEFAAYYDLMHETEPTSVQYSNIPSLPVSPSTSNTTSDTVQSFRSQKSNRRCNLRGWARCMSFCRRNFSLRKTSLSSRFRFLFPRCCCSRRWHYRHSTQFTQK